MADEQEWAGYADQAALGDTDTILARTAAGAGVEIPGSAIVKKDGAGLVGIGTAAPAAKIHVGSLPGADAARFSDLTNYTFAIRAGTGGSISLLTGTAGSALSLGSNDSQKWNLNNAGVFHPWIDNSYDLGSASFRISVIYAATGTINTSDEREKTWRSGLSDAEYAGALQIIDELGFYQWNDSIAEKGAAARMHFGARAQRVFAILDQHLGAGGWHRYAFACYDSWEDEFEPVYEYQIIPAVLDAEGAEIEPERVEAVDTGETRKILDAGDRYGLREGQFTMFLLAAQARRQSEIAARLDALEAA